MNEVTIVEVSPRDGLQNESTILSTDAKVELLNRLVDAGAKRIEAVSFAHPRLVPTMADAEAVMERAPRREGADVTLADLVAAAGLPGREDSLAHPGVGGLVVHPEHLGGVA